MKALFLTLAGRHGASPRFRIYQYLDYLASQGVEATVWPARYPRRAPVGRYEALKAFGAEYAARRRDVWRAGRFDVVVVQKGLSSMAYRGLAPLLFRRARAVAYDFDDAVHLGLRLDFTNPLLRRAQNPAEVDQLVAAAGCVLAGNAYLADWARGLTSRVTVLPTSLDTEHFRRPAAPPAPRPFVLVWSGSSSTNRYLNLVADPVSRLGARWPLRLRVISDTLEGIDVARFQPTAVDFVPWSLEREVADVAPGHIGLMPLTDDEWTRGKCGLKALLYMSLGIPAVCSPVGVNREIIADGADGLLANTPEEWECRLEELLRSSALRAELGAAGRRTVEERYSVAANGPRLLAALRACAGRGDLP